MAFFNVSMTKQGVGQDQDSIRTVSIQCLFHQGHYTKSNMFNVMSIKPWLRKVCDNQQPYL